MSQQQKVKVGTPIDPRLADGAEWTPEELAQLRAQGHEPPGRFVVAQPQQGQPRARQQARPAPVGPVFSQAEAVAEQEQEGEDVPLVGVHQPKDSYSKLMGIQQGEKDPRPGAWFTFPKSVVKTMEDPQPEYLRFFILRMKPIEEERVHDMELAQAKLGMEMVKAAVYGIGGRRTDYDEKEEWWVAIGPVGRQVVARCYQHMNLATDEQGEQVLKSAEPGTL